MYPKAKEVPKAKKVSMKNPNKARPNSKAFDPKALKKSVDSLITAIETDVQKGTKGLIGSGLGGLAGGVLAGPVGAGLGAMAGGGIGGSMEKTSKPASKPATSTSKCMSKGKGANIGRAIATGVGGAAGGLLAGPVGAAAGSKIGHDVASAATGGKVTGVPIRTTKTSDVEKGTGGLIGAGIGGLAGAALGGPIGAGLGSMAGGALGGGVGKSKDEEEEDNAKKELCKSHAQASLRVEKAIQCLQGYEPMTDEFVMKAFHGQIPEIMKEVELRPSQSWFDNAVNKAIEFGSKDPVKYSLDLWYGLPNVSKAVAEKLDSELGPKKRGEEDAINDGTRVSTKDVKPSKELVTN